MYYSLESSLTGGGPGARCCVGTVTVTSFYRQCETVCHQGELSPDSPADAPSGIDATDKCPPDDATRTCKRHLPPPRLVAKSLQIVSEIVLSEGTPVDRGLVHLIPMMRELEVALY